jgi:vacuolar-type H+-ATPase subunit I/STV1
MEQDLANVKYVGPATIKRLAEHGISSVAQLATMSPDTLAALPGIGESTAPLIIVSAQELLADAPSVLIEPEAEAVEMLAEEVPAEYFVVTPEPEELSKKELKKAAKKAKKALKKELKKVEKQQKELKKAAKKAEKKAEKVEKTEKKAKKAKKKD